MPSIRTTEHVPVPKLPVGAITSDGRMKLEDKDTGRVKYIDAKIGVALDQKGEPTHERA